MSDYCSIIFGKPLRELSYSDIEKFFYEAREENENLEFKSGQGDFEGSFVNNIIRTIVGFLNSTGGVLVWGAPKEVSPQKGKPKVTAGELIPLTISKSKDELLNRILTSISYMPKGIRIEKLQNNEKYLYIFEVQESESKPHQNTSNGIYYIRLDGQTKPAPHYLVDALFKQVKFAELEGEINFLNGEILKDTLTIEVEGKLRNMTRYQVARGVETSMHTSVGYFSQNNSQNIGVPSNYTLHYGPPKTIWSKIIIYLEDLSDKDKTIYLNLYFGSHNSIAKVSTYIIDLDKILQNKSDNKILDINNFIKKSMENVSFID